MTTVWVDCKIPHCEHAVGAQLTLTQSDIARGCHTQSFQSKGRITLGYFSRVRERDMNETNPTSFRFVHCKSNFPFHLLFVYPPSQETIHPSFTSFPNAHQLTSLRSCQTITVTNPATHSAETSKASALLPSSYPSQAPQGMGIHNTGDVPV